ncbi:MAG: hypothetical protein EOS11_27865 [Mesorhizobium sp.]|nr:MAG: hypothetical protein EOS11_27865 [Mesorhizobium sp.]
MHWRGPGDRYRTAAGLNKWATTLVRHPGALSEVGLPGHAISVALLFFNIGVELGQLLFIAVVMALFAILRPLWFGVVRPGSSWSHTMPLIGSAYCIGGIASFWLIERVYGFWA